MKTKYIFFFFFNLCYLHFVAQKNDTSKILIEVKEDFNSIKKRNFIYFISNRLSEDEKHDVYKVALSDKNPALIVIRGKFEVLGNTNQKKAEITIYNASNNSLVGKYNTSSYTGNYLLILAPNVKYLFSVTVTGYGTTKGIVEIPLKTDYEICQQELKIKLNEKSKPELLIINFFADENEKVTYLKAIVDTTKINNDADNILNLDEKNKLKEKNVNKTLNIDELVKKQIEEEKKKPEEAMKAFNNKDYEKALSIYANLLKNDQGDPFINYYYGVCLVNLDNNKAKAINSLLIASVVKEVPIDVFLYLGKAYHLSYLFQDALKSFELYKSKEKPYDFEKNNGLVYIKNCINGISLMNEKVNIEITKRTPVLLENILANYNPDLINEKVKLKTDFFYTPVDKKKQNTFLMCTNNKQEYYHVSYGVKDQNHSDIYKNTTLPDGSLAPSQLLGLEINTASDENYPYLTKDGNTLFFSSKGHNSMGGYDIFKCTRKDSLSGWSKPQNLGYPINSTYDDVLYIPNEDGQSSSYCTNRRNNSYEYIQIKLPQQAVNHCVIKGCFTTLDSIQNKEAFITVYNSNSGEIAGVYKSNAITGQYLMILDLDTKYEISADANGYSEELNSFETPEKKQDFDLKQVITFQIIAKKKSIRMINYFTAEEASKISFDIVAKKTEQDESLKKKVINKKPKRTADELENDKTDLKQALKLFNQDLFQEASLMYKNLDLIQNLDPMDSYRYGYCLFRTVKDKSNCIPYFETSLSAKTVPYMVYYYLAKSNHESYRFNTAINYYKKFELFCKAEELKNLQIEQEIKYCYSGIKLVNSPVVLEIYSKKHVDLNAIQNSLNQIESGGKVLVITDDLKSTIDKKKNFNSLLFLTADKNTLFYTSYGETEDNGKDIYQLKKLANGKWTPLPLNIKNVNSKFDEEYPSLSKDGKTLYFSSKGYENMGDYDIFKSAWNEQTETWSAPINMGSPINSPFSDIYYLE